METKVTLTSVFQQSENKLRSELGRLCLPKDYLEIQKIINKFIYSLVSDNNEFKNSLNSSDTELLNAALRMALSFQKLSLLNFIDFKTLSLKTEYDFLDEKECLSGNIIEDTLSLLPTVICAFINPWLALAMGGGTVLVKKYVKSNDDYGKSICVKERRVDISHPISEKEIDVIISSIKTICEEIDGIIKKFQLDRSDIVNQMQGRIDGYTLESKYPQILSSLQYLFMEDLRNETKNPYIQNMLFNLQGYGYNVVEYSPAKSGFFSKKSNPNVKEETMYLPAIIKDIEGSPIVVAEGIVYVPYVN